MKTKRQFTLALVVAVALAALSFVAVPRAAAQGQAPQFKVGDRVDVDTFMRGDYAGAEKLATWRKGTVLRLENPGERLGAYTVKMDEDGSEMRIRFLDSRWIRVAKTADAVAAADTKPGTTARTAPANDAKTAPGAANQAREFKVGDRVEVDVLHIGTSSPAEMQKWMKGIVTEVDRRPGYRPMYVVRIDPLPGQLADTSRIPITPNATERVAIRPGTGTAPILQTDKLRVDANDTVLADREVLDCDSLEQPLVRKNMPPPEELAKKMIRCVMGEHASPAGGQGATTVDITQFSIGEPRPWNINTDTGGGSLGTMVYPVRAQFTIKSFFRDWNTVVVNREQLFAFHVTVGKWVCGPDQVQKQGEKKQIPVKK